MVYCLLMFFLKICFLPFVHGVMCTVMSMRMVYCLSMVVSRSVLTCYPWCNVQLQCPGPCDVFCPWETYVLCNWMFLRIAYSKTYSTVFKQMFVLTILPSQDAYFNSWQGDSQWKLAFWLKLGTFTLVFINVHCPSISNKNKLKLKHAWKGNGRQP